MKNRSTYSFLPICFVSLTLVSNAVTAQNTQASVSKSSVFSGVLQNRNSITGFVFSPSRRPVDNLRVELLDEVDTVISTKLTDGTGRYIFSNLSSGTFQVRVLTNGTDYVSQTERVSITNIGGRFGTQYLQMDFVLRAKRTPGTGNTTRGITGTVFAQEVPEEALKSYKEAVQTLTRTGKEEQGLALLTKAIEIFPRYYEALERLGTEQVKRGKFEVGAITLQKALNVNPRAQASLYALGFAQYSLKQLAAAEESLRGSVAITPKSINSQFMLGKILFRAGKLAEAETHFKEAYKLDNNKKRIPEVHLNLAQIYSNSNRYREAADALELYLAEVPDAQDAEAIRNVVKKLRQKAK